jgi:hypothetical protein
MIADTVIRSEGMKALRKELGIVEAERFVNLIRREPFDYTEWQQTLWQDKSVEEIFAAAKEFGDNQNRKTPQEDR